MPNLTKEQEKAREILGITPEEYLEIARQREEREAEKELLGSLDGPITHVWDRNHAPRREGEACGINNGFETINGILVRMVSHGGKEAALVRLDQWDKEVLAHHPDNAW